MRSRLLITLASSLALLGLAASARAEVLIRWDQDQIPSRESLGLSTLVVPAKNRAAVQSALAQGYRVYLEVDAAAIATYTPPTGAIAGLVIKGQPAPAALAQLKVRLKPRGIVVRSLEERGKWPHVRANSVTNNKGVLQVSSRTQQPWVENNAALIRIAQVTQPDTTPLLTYPWQPITLAEADEGPAVENYLVAIAEAGSFGADLVLPLHARFEQNLLLGMPTARAGWKEIRDAIAFSSWDLPTRYQRIANIGVVTTDAMRWFEVMNLLARHNLSFDLVLQDKLATRDLTPFDLLIALDQPTPKQIDVLNVFAQKGGTVVLGAGLTGSPAWQSAAPVAKTETQATYGVGKGRVVAMAQPVANPDDFAMEIRQVLGRDKRAIEIWNGITVIAAPFAAPGKPPAEAALAKPADAKPGEAETVLLTLLNYAHEELPVQLRVQGRFSAVRYESPQEPPVLLPYQQRNGYTEFVLPALRVGGRAFLTRDTSPPEQSGSSAVIESAYAPKNFELTADPNSPEWAKAPRVMADHNYLNEPIPGPPTEIRSRWTKDYLYLLYVCPYNELNLKPEPNPAAETPRLWNWEVGEAFIGSDYEHIARYKELQVSPQSEWVDLDIDRDDQKGQQGMAWNSGYTVKGRIDAQAKVWYGEMRIPFSAIDPREPQVGRELRIGLYRIAGKEPTKSYYAWSPTGQKNFHVPQAFGTLRLR